MCKKQMCRCYNTWDKVGEGDVLTIRHEKYGVLNEVQVINGHKIRLAANRFYLGLLGRHESSTMWFGTTEDFELQGWVIDSLKKPEPPLFNVPPFTVIGLRGYRYYPFVVTSSGNLRSVVSGVTYTKRGAKEEYGPEFVVISRPV